VVRDSPPPGCADSVTGIERDPLEGLEGDLLAQRAFVEPRAPVYARLIDALYPLLEGEVADRLRASWSNRRFGPFYERPMLLLAAIRDDSLREGDSHPLWAAVGRHDPDLEAVSDEVVAAALASERDHLWRTLATRYVQTNDISRAVAWIWPAAVAAEEDPDRPLALVDVGASAGLNLVADRTGVSWERAGGGELLDAPLPPIAGRTGYDLRPVDVFDEAQARWLRACIWPGQRTRAEGLESGIAAYRDAAASPDAPRLEELDAADVPARLPVPGRDDPRAIVYGTIMRDYLPEDVRKRYREGMRGWLEASAPGTAIWSELEITTEERTEGPPVDLTVHVRSDGGTESLVLGRCEPHPRSIEVTEEAVERLRAALRLPLT
jgi:hypothetical protein